MIVVSLVPVCIKKIVPGGAAAMTGALQVNDIILEVNGKSLERLTYRVSVNV